MLLGGEKVQLEVNIEDNFWPGKDEESMTSGGRGEKAIAPETWESWFQQWLQQLASYLPPAKGYELSVRLTDDKEIQAFNAQYRQLDQATDVLSFAALETSLVMPAEHLSLHPCYLGDIIISVETALRQAQQAGHNLTTELAWLTSHGLLHLLGWDHPDDRSLTRMLEQQKALLQKVNLQIGSGYAWDLEENLN